MSNPVIILGAGGQVGEALCRLGPETGWTPHGFKSADVDITDVGKLRQLADQYPDVPVVNAAAYTAVDRAEDDQDAALRVNTIAPTYLAELFGHDRPLVHYSTDYVFDGSGTAPYQTADETNPLGVYGLTKRGGELAVLSSPFGSVIRTAWVYSATGHNFLKTMLRVGPDRGQLNVVDDQRGCPTHADDIALATYALLSTYRKEQEAAAGLYHYTAGGEATWFDFARAIFTSLKVETGTDVTVSPIKTADYPTRAQRPAYSVLDSSALLDKSGADQLPWEARVADTVRAVLAAGGQD